MVKVLKRPTSLLKESFFEIFQTFHGMIRSQWGMCFKFNIIMTLSLAIWTRTFQLTGDMTILYPFIQGSLWWPFSELFSSDISLWNQYKYIAFNIFSCRILMIAYKMLIITSTVKIWCKSKWINHICNIMSKRHNILLT